MAIAANVAASLPLRYYANAVLFDGTNDYMTRGAALSGVSSAKVGTLSFWLNLAGGNGSLLRILAADVAGPAARLAVLRNTDNKFYVLGYNSAGTEIMNFNSSGTYTSSSGWLHFAASWDLAAAALQMYINGATASPTITTNTNDTIAYASAANWAVGALTDGSAKLNADLAEFYFNSVARIDLSVAANLAKFRQQSRPPDLGPTGASPSGSQPICYFRGPASAFPTNLGSGGNFTVTGTLTNSSSSPSG